MRAGRGSDGREAVAPRIRGGVAAPAFRTAASTAAIGWPGGDIVFRAGTTDYIVTEKSVGNFRSVSTMNGKYGSMALGRAGGFGPFPATTWS